MHSEHSTTLRGKKKKREKEKAFCNLAEAVGGEETIVMREGPEYPKVNFIGKRGKKEFHIILTCSERMKPKKTFAFILPLVGVDREALELLVKNFSLRKEKKKWSIAESEKKKGAC